MAYKIQRLPAVKAVTGLSRSTIYLKISKNEFPAPISLGARAVGWLESDINAWLDEKVKASRGVK
jgi:prophage regulatory protein